MFPNPDGITVGTVLSPPDNRRLERIGWWLAVVASVLLIAFTWTGYSSNSFHVDDIHTIVENPSLRPEFPLARIFSTTRATSSLAEYAAYRPLTTLTYAIDTRIGGTDDQTVFQLDSFLWFFIILFAVYGLVRLMPGAGPFFGLLAAALCAVHPLASQALNYTSQRHLLLRTLGVALSLLVFVAWPSRMPEKFWFPVRRIPRNYLDVLIRRLRTLVSNIWELLLRIKPPFYFVPLVFGLLADPGTAVFPLILIAWIKLFEPEKSLRKVIPSAVVCGIWWIAHTAMTWSSGAPVRPPLPDWWLTQPAVALDYVAAFFYPGNLTADSGVQTLAGISAWAMVGVAGLAGLIALAFYTSRHNGWKIISFGIWWFLIALIPEFLVPQRDAEVWARGFVAGIGLAIAVAGAAAIVVSWFWKQEQWRLAGAGLVAIVALSGLAILGNVNHRRNNVWQSQDYLWSDVLEHQPGNARALLNYGRVQIAGGDAEAGYKSLEKARVAQPKDAEIELELAQFAEAAGKADADQHFKRAIELAPSSSFPPARYAEWLLLKQRTEEAEKEANRALALDSVGIAGRRAVIAVQVAERRWQDLEKFSNQTIELTPGAPDGHRGLRVARTALDEIINAEKLARSERTTENLLRLSSVYMQNGRFDEGIAACQAALKIQPQLAEAWSNISVGYHMMGKIDESIAALREAIRIRPDLRGLQDNLAAELRAKGQPTK